MAYDCVRALRYKGYLDYVRWKVDGLKEYAGTPRKWQVHNQELFDLWVERAEILKEARDRIGKNQKPVDDSRSKNDPQSVLTWEFFSYFKSQQTEELESFFYQLCTNRAISRSKKKPMLYDRNEMPHEAQHSVYKIQLDGLYAIINFIEWIVGV